jgi:hypothetical protein
MSQDRRYFLIGGLAGAFFLGTGYYLLWVSHNDLGWVFLALAVANYLRVQRRVRTY